MGTNNVLELVEKCLDEHRPAESGTYALYVEDHEVRLCRWPTLQGYEKVIARLSSNDVTYGLTSKQWEEIHTKLRRLRYKGVI